MGELIERYLPQVIHLIEMIGIIIIAVGCLKTFFDFVRSFFTKVGSNIRLELGKSLALGLEYKLGAEILKTVLIRDMQEIWILGSIIILRAVLSLLIHFELKTEFVTPPGALHQSKP